MNFDEYQRRAATTDQAPGLAETTSDDTRDPKRSEVIPLLGIVGEIGTLLGEYKKLLRDGEIHRKFRDEVAEELGDILWYVANVSTKFDLSLSEIAADNLRKVEDRWKPSSGQPALYDNGNPVAEQLPRKFEYEFRQRTIDGQTQLSIRDRLRGDPTGDPLTDNAYDDDGYRFHDVLHLAFAACFGWSPVLRKLLRTKRQILNRTPGTVADAEDGGRAQVIEEAIVAAAYVYAADHDFLNGAAAVDWHLLRHIKQMTSILEVRNRSTWDWNQTLLRGFEIWRQLREHGGGIVSGDLEARMIEFTPVETE